MVRPIKRKQIPNLQEAIKDTAWKQLAEFGAPALSLRAIARELKITAPAIYNYFPNRDALVTALIVVGAFGPKSSGLPKPCRAISSSAASSLIVDSHACPAALHESVTESPMSGS